jgi:hypothetical protein
VRTAPGQGATFRIALPLTPEALDHPEDADPADDPAVVDEADEIEAEDEVSHGLGR